MRPAARVLLSLVAAAGVGLVLAADCSPPDGTEDDAPPPPLQTSRGKVRTEDATPVASDPQVRAETAVEFAAGPGDAAVDVWALVADFGKREGELVGPFAAAAGPDGKRRLVIPGRVLRWWARTPSQWLAGAVEGGAPASHWGEFGLVRVRDAAGRPAGGVDLTITTLEGQLRTRRGGATTDADGIALLPVPPTHDRSAAGGRPVGPLRLTADVPALPAPSWPFAREGPWPLELRLPRLASVAVRLDEAPAGLGAFQVRLDPLVEGSPWTGYLPSAVAPVVDGVARFPSVGPGLPFRATLMASPARFVSTAIEFDAPAAGATREVRLRLGPERPRIAGRVVDPAGNPLPHVSVTLTVERPSAASPWTDVADAHASSNAEGRFEASVDVVPEELTGAELDVAVGSEPAVAKHRSVPRAAAGAVVDLGEVVAAWGPPQPTEVVAAGRVVDEAGAGVAYLPVQVWRRRGDAWTYVTMGQCDASGAFALRGRSDPADACEVRLAHTADWYAAGPVPVRSGATDVRLVVRRAGSVLCDLRLPPGLAPFAGPWITLAPAGDEPFAPGDPAAEDGPWHAGGRAPGAYRFVVHAPYDVSRVLFARDLTLESGRTVDLGVLDVTGVVPTISVTVRDASGTPAADAAVWWRPSDPTDRDVWQPLACGPEGVRLAAFSPVDVLARRTGSGFAHATRVSADVVLVPPAARPRTDVTVVLADDAALPEPPYRLRVGIHRLDPALPLRTRFGAPADPRNDVAHGLRMGRTARRGRLVAHEPGRWVVVPMLQVAGRGAPVQTDATFDVDDSGAPREVVLRITPAALEDAKARLRQE